MLINTTTLYSGPPQVHVIRPPPIEDLLSAKQLEEVLEEVPEGAETPYEPGLAYVYSLTK